tara:strand:+ start:2310 stop:2501 length:192 start_codon:yes stop_codon:yes gene_type:complete
MDKDHLLECEIREHLRLVNSAKNPMDYWRYTWRPLLVKHRGEEAVAEITRLMNIERKRQKNER